jgi:hypothetical protein
MNRPSRPALNASLWTAQAWLALVFALSGLLKALVPAADLQARLGFMVAAQAGILRPVGLVELVLSVALIVPAGARVLPRLTPFAAACLGATVLLGLVQPASAGGLGRLVPDLLLLAASAFVAWGRLVAVPVEPASFGPEPELEDPAAAARLERNRQRHAARHGRARDVA